MRVEELPEAKSIGIVPADLKHIERTLHSAFPDGLKKPLCYVACIKANKTKKFACFVYAQINIQNLMLQMEKPIMTLDDLARILFRMTRETYYKKFPNPGQTKGWEIRVAKIAEGDSIIAIPTWIQ